MKQAGIPTEMISCLFLVRGGGKGGKRNETAGYSDVLVVVDMLTSSLNSFFFKTSLANCIFAGLQ